MVLEAPARVWAVLRDRQFVHTSQCPPDFRVALRALVQYPFTKCAVRAWGRVADHAKTSVACIGPHPLAQCFLAKAALKLGLIHSVKRRHPSAQLQSRRHCDLAEKA